MSSLFSIIILRSGNPKAAESPVCAYKCVPGSKKEKSHQERKLHTCYIKRLILSTANIYTDMGTFSTWRFRKILLLSNYSNYETCNVKKYAISQFIYWRAILIQVGSQRLPSGYTVLM